MQSERTEVMNFSSGIWISYKIFHSKLLWLEKHPFFFLKKKRKFCLIKKPHHEQIHRRDPRCTDLQYRLGIIQNGWMIPAVAKPKLFFSGEATQHALAVGNPPARPGNSCYLDMICCRESHCHLDCLILVFVSKIEGNSEESQKIAPLEWWWWWLWRCWWGCHHLVFNFREDTTI